MNFQLVSTVTEFIHLIASEASEISDREQRKTILPEHIIEALTVTLHEQKCCPKTAKDTLWDTFNSYLGRIFLFQKY